MERDLERLASREYDLAIVGGGITGACIAHDAALRGMSVALVDKSDFAGATTASSSKLIHGGLRYLQNLEFGMVRESLRERRIWSNVAPHLVDSLAFLTPMYDKKSRVKMAIGLRAYDWLAFDRKKLDDPEKILPAHKHLTRAETLEKEPALASDTLTGAMIFYDYQMYSPERIALACIQSAVELGAEVANYVEAIGFILEDDRICGIRARDVAVNAGGEEFEIRARLTVNAAGPWADRLLARRPDAGSPPRLLRSKGIHLVTRAISKNAIAVPSRGSHFFILPWRGHSILGTTDTAYMGDPDDVCATEKDIVDFLAAINEGYPSAKLVRGDVVFFYAGLRPLVDTSEAVEAVSSLETKETYTVSRASEIFDHEKEEKQPGMLTVIGGKWTTSRHLAEKTVDLIAAKLDLPKHGCVTATSTVYGGDTGPFADFLKQAVADHPSMSPEIVENLARNYGSHYPEVLQYVRDDAALGERLAPDRPDIGAQVVHAVREEMALTISDVVFRRTGLGAIGNPGLPVIERIGDIMAKELEWDFAERQKQIVRAGARFISWARTCAIVNPHSWGNRTGALWPELEAKLTRIIGPVETVFTDAPGAATRLARAALRKGMQQIIAVGGDGTINEVVNGFFENGALINPEALFSILTSGTGCDFRRTFGVPDGIEAQIERLAHSEIRTIDLGRVTYVNDAGETESRYFNNIASFGLSGATVRAVNKLTFGKKFSGKAAFYWGMLKALATYRRQPVRVQVDDHFDETMRVTTAAVSNGQYFGGSMHIAPEADPCDGLFDLVIARDFGPIEIVYKSGLIYRGDHLSDPKVILVKGKKVTVSPALGATSEILLDVDGEAPGRLPATFEILPAAIHLRC